jgi:heterodisulfide reductase subunit B2
MKIGYYPGCSLKGSAREYGESLLAVSRAMGIELEEVADWNCCGSTAAHNLDRELSLALPARILATAEKQGMEDIVVPCAACFHRLSLTRQELLGDEETRKKISRIIAMEVRGSVRVMNVLEFLERFVVDGIGERLKVPFDRKVACYYGCFLVRPPKVVCFDRSEDPRSMDEILKKIGATPVEWAYKVECCGAGFSVSRTDLVARLSGEILEDALSRGAEAIIVACPMCHSNLDMRRRQIEKRARKRYPIPVVYVTQAVGMALGLGRKELGLHRHFVPVAFTEKSSGSRKGRKPAQSGPARNESGVK